jgi:hypothetical protein
MFRISAAFFICLLGVRPVSADPFTLDVSPVPAHVGDIVTLTMHGEVTDLQTLVLHPFIDTAHLSLLTFVPGSLLPGADDPLNSFLDLSDPANPELLFASNGATGVTGADVTIAVMTFQAIATGSATVVFSDTPLSTLDPLCDPANLASCYEHNLGGDPTPISGSATVEILASETPIPAPGPLPLVLGLLGIASIRWARG